MFYRRFQAEICSKITIMKTLVVYYSGKGSNKYLAEKIAQTLHCDVEAIVPRKKTGPKEATTIAVITSQNL